jgi:rod shape-determining protein MreC
MARGSGNRSRLLLIILLVTSLFLVTLDLRGVSLTKSSRSITQSVLAPVQKGVSTVFSPVGRFFSDIKNFGKTKDELDKVKIANGLLKAQLAKVADNKGALNQLKGLLNLAGQGGYKIIPARVIGRGSSASFSQTITIDAGSSDGISVNQTVISQNGLIGVVKVVAPNSAIILLISDPSFKVGVRIARSQSIGVLLGEGNSQYQLELLDPTGTIENGDVLVTNGSQGNRPFVPGVPVGQVTSVDQKNSSLTQTAIVKSYANLNDLGVVSVIISAPTIAPKTPINPTPQPTITVLVTPTPTATPSLTPTPSPSPRKSKA